MHFVCWFITMPVMCVFLMVRILNFAIFSSKSERSARARAPFALSLYCIHAGY